MVFYILDAIADQFPLTIILQGFRNRKPVMAL